jgi:class 3 adenylate cyclase
MGSVGRDRTGGRPRGRSAGLWIVVVVPLAVAGILVVRPSLDGLWQEQRLHFWIVSVAALGGTVVAAAAAEAAAKRDDLRLFLLGFSFAAAAAALGLHALATPTVLVDGPTAGFETVVPAGLALSALGAASATVPFSEPLARQLLRSRRAIWAVFGVVVVGAATAIVTETGFLAATPDETARNGVVDGLGVAGSLLFAFAALRLIALRRDRVSVRILTAVTVALLLLGDALAVTPIGRTWQASWWEWHLLMAAAFVATAWTLRAELQRESGRAGLLDGLALDATLERVRREDADALEHLVDALETFDGDSDDDAEVRHMVADVVARFQLTDRQGELLQQAAHALHDNRRLYQELDGLFRSYLSPDVAAALVAHPSLAELGGTHREVSVLHADLSGFTAFSEGRSPAAVLDMLNASFGAVVPPILAEGGTITLFAGDALMAVFGAPVVHPDHAARACRAAQALLHAADAVAAPGWPRFRVGVSTGPAIVGNVGSDALRSYTAIGDTVNLAARLEGAAPVGGICISEPTRAALGAAHATDPYGPLDVKGRVEPVTAHLLRR